MGTVYRNLDFLASSGEILRLDRAGAQKHFDGNPMPHHHVRCTVCGRIGDVHTAVSTPACDGVCAPGFDIHDVEVEFIGICGECKQQQQ